MPQWREQALILRLGHFRESDLWLRALLKNQGLVTLFAFGGAKSKKRFCGCLDQLNTLDCAIKPSRGGEYLSLEEASLINSPSRLRQDWRGMGIAANCARFAEACGIGPECAGEAFALMEALRDLLEQGAKRRAMLPLFFRLRLAAILGYAPDFASCANCGSENRPWGYFQVDEGLTYCPSCSLGGNFAQKRRGMKLFWPTLDLLLKVQQNLPRLWPLDLDDAIVRPAGRAIDGFIQFHLGLEWDNGIFRRI